VLLVSQWPTNILWWQKWCWKTTYSGFAGPKPGLGDFVKPFNQLITTCFRVVNFLDIIPCLPPWPYEQVGVAINIDSGGPFNPVYRHSLYAYEAGLEKLMESSG
jgi:triacylglycerol lipase